MKQEIILQTGETYHVFNKSIAGFTIFNSEFEYERMLQATQYYQIAEPALRLSYFIQKKRVESPVKERSAISTFTANHKGHRLVRIVAYCLMPTHFHFVLTQLQDNGISSYVQNVCNSYTRYFNLRHKRRGPLWEGKFKKVRVESDDQLLHLTRYVHLNPVTAYLTEKPEDWTYSSYREYVLAKTADSLCCFENLLKINRKDYRNFVQKGIGSQRELAKIKKLLLD